MIPFQEVVKIKAEGELPREVIMVLKSLSDQLHPRILIGLVV